jgi:hypothetical protein
MALKFVHSLSFGAYLFWKTSFFMLEKLRFVPDTVLYILNSNRHATHFTDYDSNRSVIIDNGQYGSKQRKTNTYRNKCNKEKDLCINFKLISSELNS